MSEIFQRVRVSLPYTAFGRAGKRLKESGPAREGAILFLILVVLSFGFIQEWRLVYPRLRTESVHPAPTEMTTGEVAVWEDWLSPLEEIREIAKRAALRHGIDPALIQSMIAVESSFDPFALSNKGAMGVMQLMPATAVEMGVADPYDVRENIDGGVRYLKKLLRRYRGNLWLALAAYNAGPSRVRQYRGIPPYAETRRYVRDVIARYRKLKSEETS
ncbi:MAG: lytic transglycosylase domain-containing protein [Nitrospinota bacterium]